MEIAPFFVNFHHFLSIFTIFCRFSRFTHFCRDLQFFVTFFVDFHDLRTVVAIYILSRFTHFFRQFFLAKIAITATKVLFLMYDRPIEESPKKLVPMALPRSARTSTFFVFVHLCAYLPLSVSSPDEARCCPISKDVRYVCCYTGIMFYGGKINGQSASGRWKGRVLQKGLLLCSASGF